MNRAPSVFMILSVRRTDGTESSRPRRYQAVSELTVGTRPIIASQILR